jgi:hypothetical protein
MIDKWDIQKFEWFLRLAKVEGTDIIKIVAGDFAGTWTVAVSPKYIDEQTRGLIEREIDNSVKNRIAISRKTHSIALPSVGLIQ